MHPVFKRMKIGLIVGLLPVLLIGCGTPEATEPITEATEPTEVTTAQATEPETTAAPTEETVPLATIAGEDLLGIWIACAEPVISDDTNYTHTAKAGYYEFDGSGNFTFTQILLAERGTWAPLEGEQIVHRGTYTLSGDMLTLHYTEEAGVSVDYTEEISMNVDRSCADMCVRLPDHPKLGALMFFRKARAGNPVNAIMVLLSGGI